MEPSNIFSHDQEHILLERSNAETPESLAILLNNGEDFWRSSPSQLPRKYRKRKYAPVDQDVYILDDIIRIENVDGINYVHVDFNENELENLRFKRLIYNGNKINRFCTRGVYYHWTDRSGKGKKSSYRRDHRGNNAAKNFV